LLFFYKSIIIHELDHYPKYREKIDFRTARTRLGEGSGNTRE